MAELVDATDLIQFERYEGNFIGERFQIQGNLVEYKISIGYPEPNLTCNANDFVYKIKHSKR
jgi:hypothetical protein